MFCKEHFDFQALDDIHCVMRLHFEEDGVSVAYFFSHFLQIKSLYWGTESSFGEWEIKLDFYF